MHFGIDDGTIARIASHFGDTFAQGLPARLAAYAKQWRLSDFAHIDYYSVNCIFTCSTAQYGDAVLKIGEPSPETLTEYAMLQAYAKRGFCRALAEDAANGALLIERIAPGTQLRAEPDTDKRLAAFCGLWQNLHIPANGHSYPTRADWMHSAAQDAAAHPEYPALSLHMEKALPIFEALRLAYPRQMLLHGDLHHDNILLSKNGYTIIDPKGVIGDPVFDIPRFLINELDNDLSEACMHRLVYMITELAKRLHIPETDLRRLVYIETVMCESWSANGGIPALADLDFAERLMNGGL